ncbi:MAG: hypothetical protein PHR35_03695 [Kiritimatiellae bacterium]|nr:hypothetical protein [Kiritimatiellia bacterium]
MQLSANPLRAHAPDASARADLAALLAQGLDPADIGWEPDGPCDPQWSLAVIADWLRVWRLTGGDRAEMARRGYHFPPVEPDCDPDQDWLTFERWAAARPLTWRYEEEEGELPPAGTLSEAEVMATFTAITAKLSARGVDVMLAEGTPVRTRYAWLREELLARPIAYLAPDTRLVLDGCGGDCESCFQQSWCDIGAMT